MTDLGGTVHVPPQDIPGVGRFALVADPQGACFSIMRDDSGRDSVSFAPDRPGHCSWNELITTDQDAALAFYGALFGWTRAGAIPMPDGGNYAFFGPGDGAMLGAVMTAQDHHPVPRWNFAFTVSDIDDARAAVEGNGGILRGGPLELPGDQGDWMIQISDPQGAGLMLTGKRGRGR